MLLPTSVDLLRCIERTLETVIVPRLTGTEERSAAATIGHLLRHVALRIDQEGGMLAEDIAALRVLLEQVAEFLEAHHGGDDRAASLRSGIAAALARPAEWRAYRNVASLAEEVSVMRRCVCEALIFMQTVEGDSSGPAARIRDALHRYAAWEVEQEARLIDPAFEGFGPRR